MGHKGNDGQNGGKKILQNVNTDEGRQRYRSLNNALRQETDRAKEAWWERECNEMEELGRKGMTDVLYSKVQKLSDFN